MVGAIGQDIAMKKVIFLLLILAIGLGVFVAGALHLDRLEPLLLRLGIDPDHWIVEEALRAVGVVVIGAPLAVLLWTLAGLGSNAATTDIHGDTVLRLKAGSRFGFAVLALFLAGVSFFAVAIDDEATLAFKVIVPVFGLAFAYAAILFLVAKVRFNNTTLFVTGISGRLKSYQWADLQDIKTNTDAKEYIFIFRDGRKARVSFFYQDLRRLMGTAYARLEHNARIA